MGAEGASKGMCLCALHTVDKIRPGTHVPQEMGSQEEVAESTAMHKILVARRPKTVESLLCAQPSPDGQMSAVHCYRRAATLNISHATAPAVNLNCVQVHKHTVSCVFCGLFATLISLLQIYYCASETKSTMHTNRSQYTSTMCGGGAKETRTHTHTLAQCGQRFSSIFCNDRR